MSQYKIGDRVRAKDINDVGEDFRGLTGVVVGFSASGGHPLVSFDNPPSWDTEPPQGGSWPDGLLESLEAEPTEEEIAKLFGLNTPLPKADHALAERVWDEAIAWAKDMFGLEGNYDDNNPYRRS